jgi:Holliday junction resolvasome RuvABC endonuclease subunit
MTTNHPTSTRVLAIDPTTKGFGFAILEGTERLVDWGVAQVGTPKHARSLRRADQLIQEYLPDVMIVEDAAGDGSRRCERVERLLRDLRALAAKRGLRTWSFGRGAVRKAFASAGATTKEQIAGVLAAWYPELLLRLPPPRKPWMSEDERMGIFDAAALARTYFARQRRQNHACEARAKAA